jgi:hypothetical protein
MPAPPYSSSTVMPSRPSVAELAPQVCGNSLSRSISAARGAISATIQLLNRQAMPRSVAIGASRVQVEFLLQALALLQQDVVGRRDQAVGFCGVICGR